jgi:TonB-linked SusC/RagA family outer membrane protein
MIQLLKQTKLLLLLLFFSIAATAQTKTIKGTVADEKRAPLSGATIIVKETGTTVQTDADGKFTIEVAAKAKRLLISYVGMATKEVNIGNGANISITLSSGTKDLGEVVVIGYGTQNKRDVNGAIASVKADQIRNIPHSSIDQMLQGRVSGVTVTQNSGAPGSATSVKIRGINSLGSNEPLYVIDGVPVLGDARNSSTSGRAASVGFDWAGGGNGQTAVSPLAALNPNDIASVEILKDASAAAIYGNRAANGVVIITTKRGKNADGKIVYDTYFGAQRPSKYLEVMNLQEYAKFENDLSVAYSQAPRVDFADPSILGTGTNWQKELFRQAAMQSHQLSFSGGKDAVNYFVSGGYFNQDGIVVGSNFKRYSIRANIDGQVKKWLKIGTSLAATRTNERITLNDDMEGVISGALLQAPDMPVRNSDGKYAGPSTTNGAEPAQNPVAKALLIDNTIQRDKIFGSVYAEISFLKNFTLRTEFAGDFSNSDKRGFKPTYEWGRIKNAIAVGFAGIDKSQYWDAKQILTYNAIYNKNRFTVMAGHEVSEVKWNGVAGIRSDFPSNDIRVLSLGNPLGATNDEYRGSQALESYFGRVIYTYDNRYSLTATVRADGSSKFDQSAGNQWGYFPAMAAGWTVTNEKFMKDIKWVNNLKLRIGYGEIGNQNIPNYTYGSSLVQTPTGIGLGFYPNNIPNKDVTWEKQKQTNIGIDVAVLKNKVELSFDYFKKISTDFLLPLPLPDYLGVSGNGAIKAPVVNAGEIENKGFDVSLRVNKVNLGPVEWNTSAVISAYKNKVNDLKDLEFVNKVQFGTLAVSKVAQGLPVGVFVGYKTDGLFTDVAQFAKSPKQFGLNFQSGYQGVYLGDVKYVDVNGDGVVDANDATIIGNPNPDFTYGFTNSFSFKGIDVSIFIQGSHGGEIMNIVKRSVGGLDKLFNNQLKAYSNYWTPTNTGTSIPRPRPGTDNQNLVISDRFIEDASYMRIQNISVGYHLPRAVVKRLKVVQSVRFYGSIQNLKTFTNYSGFDPEVGAFNQNTGLMNVDNGRYPVPRTMSVGVNLEF